jgi:predicted XRE-type DNA-binding protein
MRLVIAINQRVAASKLSNSRAAAAMAIDQLKVLALQSYNLYAFSVDRLMGYVEALKATAGN